MTLNELKELPKGTTLYTVLRKVSRSGMTRVMDILYIENNTPLYIRGEDFPSYIKTIQQALKEGGNYKVYGAGMDMGFDLIYRLGQYAHGDGYYFKQAWI